MKAVSWLKFVPACFMYAMFGFFLHGVFFGPALTKHDWAVFKLFVLIAAVYALIRHVFFFFFRRSLHINDDL